MNPELNVEAFTELVNLLTEVKTAYDNGTDLNDTNYNGRIATVINKIFGEGSCYSVYLTNNIDRPLFGVRVNPIISQDEAIKTIFTDENISYKTFSLEIDLSLFKTYDATEVAAYVVEDIASLMNPEIINSVRALMDLAMVGEGKEYDVQNSIAYTQILIFGIKDIIHTITSLLYKDISMIGANKYSKAFETGEILAEIAGSLRDTVFENQDVTAAPKLGILRWCIMIYDDLDNHYRDAECTLKQAICLTGSVLEQNEAKKTLAAIEKAANEVVAENADVYKSFCESFFGRLKRNGLRSIQDDLYEYRIRMKNCDNIDEAAYIIHQINSRIAILEDYIDTEDISPAERERWQRLIADYMMLRAELSKKKIGPKNYGIFVDYDKLDRLDDPS